MKRIDYKDLLKRLLLLSIGVALASLIFAMPRSISEVLSMGVALTAGMFISFGLLGIPK